MTNKMDSFAKKLFKCGSLVVLASVVFILLANVLRLTVKAEDEDMIASQDEYIDAENIDIDVEDEYTDTADVYTDSDLQSASRYRTNYYDAYGAVKINVLVAAIDPTLSSLDGSKYGNNSTYIKASNYLRFSLDDSVTFWCDTFEEISHQTVDINVVDTVVIDEFPKYKTLEQLNNESFQSMFKKTYNGYGDWYGGVTSEAFKPYDGFGDLDYSYYIDKLDLVNRRNAGEFDVLLLVGVDPLQPYESCMVGRKPFWINGQGVTADCDNFVVVTPTFSRKDGSIENVGHMAEQMLGYIYGNISYERGCIDGSDYSALNDWQKYCLCEYLATPNTTVYGYGMVHFSPNSKQDYDWENPTSVKYYKDWKNGTGIEDFAPSTTYLGNTQFNYQNDACISHHKWWFSNMPYADGRDEDGYFKNWWRYIFTPDYVTSISSDQNYSYRTVTLNIDEQIPINFTLSYYSGKIVNTNTVESAATVISGDNSLVTVSNGKILGLKKGTTTLEVRIDGKSIKYNVKVMDPNDQDEDPEDSFNLANKVIKGYSLDLVNGALTLKVDTELTKELNGNYIKIKTTDGKVSSTVLNSTNETYQKVFNVNVAAKDIFDNVEISIVSAESDVLGYTTISVYEYAKEVKEQDSKYAKFVDAMLRYGAYAHIYFYNSKPEGYTFDKEYSASDYSVIASQIYPKAGINIEGYLGTTLVLEDKITLRHYFDRKVTYSSYRVGYYCVQYSFNPNQLNYSISGYYYTINDYIRKALTEDCSIELKNLMCALYEYGIAANGLK